LGNVTFADADGNSLADGLALTQTGAAAIVLVNGTAEPAGTRHVNGVAPASNGTISVTMDSGAFDCATLVAFRDTNGNHALDLGAREHPLEPFAVAGPIGWLPPEAANGATGGLVQFVDRSRLVVVAGGQTYNLQTADTPYYNASFRIPFDMFLSAVSVGDAFDFFSGQYSRVAPNTFDLYQDRPATPTNVSVQIGDFDSSATDSAPNDVQVVWAAPTPLDALIDHYVIRRYNADGSVLEATLATSAGSGPLIEALVDVDVPSGLHRYTVQAVAETGDAGGQSDVATASVA
jgi:hypothetical protein